MTKNTYKAFYKHGLKEPTVIYAEDLKDAMNVALAEYRRTAGFVETVLLTDMNHVVDHVDLILNDEEA